MSLLNLVKHINTRRSISNYHSEILRCMKEYTYKNKKNYYDLLLQQSNTEFNPYGYRRIPMYVLDNVEVQLLEWKPYSFSQTYYHQDKTHTIFLVRNQLLQQKYCVQTKKSLDVTCLQPDKIYYIDSQKYIHSLFNTVITDSNTLSVHIYPK